MCSGCRGSNSSADAPSSCCSSPTVVEVPERCSPPTKTKRCGRHGALPTSHSSAQAAPPQPPPRATGAIPGVGLDAASAWTTTDALRVRSARACTPRCCDPALTACSASSRGCSSSRPTTAANTSASASARRTSTVVNNRVAGLRVPPRLGLALLAALERGADGETSGLRLVERIALPARRGKHPTTHCVCIVTGNKRLGGNLNPNNTPFFYRTDWRKACRVIELYNWSRGGFGVR